MIYGINITDIYGYIIETRLRALSGPRKTARIVIDSITNIQDAIPVVRMVKHYCDVMIQIQDSYGEAKLSDSQLFAKADKLFTTFKDDCKLWEIGNEINGDWCSPNIVERVKSIWLMMPTEHKAMVTLFCDGNFTDWYARNPIKVDYVGLSFYPQNDDWSYDWNILTDKITGINPNCQVGISECGFEEWTDSKLLMSWRNRAKIKNAMCNPKVNNPKWFGSGFYWDGQTEGF